MSEEYDLRKSTEKIGELYPVIVSKSGEIVDGFHRINAKANWRRDVREDIDTPEKVLKARLIANKFRRQVTAEEVRGWINDLAEIALTEHGVQPGGISGWVAEETGYNRDHVASYLNLEYKDPYWVQRGKELAEIRYSKPNLEDTNILSAAESLIRVAEPTVDLESVNGLQRAAKALEREANRKVKAQKTPEQLEAEKTEKARKAREKREADKLKKEQEKQKREQELEKVRQQAIIKTKAEAEKKIVEIQETAKEEAKQELAKDPNFIRKVTEQELNKPKTEQWVLDALSRAELKETGKKLGQEMREAFLKMPKGDPEKREQIILKSNLLMLIRQIDRGSIKHPTDPQARLMWTNGDTIQKSLKILEELM